MTSNRRRTEMASKKHRPEEVWAKLRRGGPWLDGSEVTHGIASLVYAGSWRVTDRVVVTLLVDGRSAPSRSVNGEASLCRVEAGGNALKPSLLASQVHDMFHTGGRWCREPSVREFLPRKTAEAEAQILGEVFRGSLD
jgi:hypothetical protein